MKELSEFYTNYIIPNGVLIIYLIGYILSYYSLRYILKRENAWNYYSFVLALIISFLSYLSFIVFLIHIFTLKIKDLDNKKPPKWL